MPATKLTIFLIKVRIFSIKFNQIASQSVKICRNFRRNKGTVVPLSFTLINFSIFINADCKITESFADGLLQIILSTPTHCKNIAV